MIGWTVRNAEGETLGIVVDVLHDKNDDFVWLVRPSGFGECCKLNQFYEQGDLRLLQPIEDVGGPTVWCVFDGSGVVIGVGVDKKSALDNVPACYQAILSTSENQLYLRPDKVQEGWTIKKMKLGGEA